MRKPWTTGATIIGLILAVVLPRLTALNQYVIVDEADRWRWAKEFVLALSRGDLAGTRVGDGYPGIVPIWAESIGIFIEAVRRSLVGGAWLDEAGLHLLLHEWERTAFLAQQRLPIVLLNIGLVLAVIGVVWRLWGREVALVGGLLMALDPFYLSDSRVNRAEAVITGLMTLSMLALALYHQQRRRRYILISGLFGGLSFLTKIQALAILPAVVLAGGLICWPSPSLRGARGQWWLYLSQLIRLGLLWAAAACLTWLILWPAMWVTPTETLALVYNYTTRKVGEEGVNLFFWGQTYQDADPGFLFYPLVFLLRITPVALLGLLALGWWRRGEPGRLERSNSRLPSGAMILIIYIAVYALVMSLGSHKQDRYLLPIFLSVDILAAIGLCRLLLRSPLIIHHLSFIILLLQALTIWPHHPYYYSYFNPLLGGGQTAVKLLRVGWGEGMDQVGAYLAQKPNSRELVVSSRFTHNMLGFKGELIALGPDGRWTQSDYVVLYVQQVQRRQDPSPGFIDYFLARPPEHVITLGDIEYAWIYPIPFSVPANPQVSLLPDEAALLGYRWEANEQIRVVWENLGITDDGRQLVARVGGGAWAVCEPDTAFATRARTPGAYVESLCAPTLAGLSPGIYTVEFGLEHKNEGSVAPFTFPEGRQAMRFARREVPLDTTPMERLEAIVAEAVPEEVVRLERVYDGGRLRLAAYRLDPPQPTSGQTVEVMLYWQRIQEVAGPLHLVVQLADSRSISLGRADTIESAQTWLQGEVVTTRHTFDLAPDLDTPLAGQLEVNWFSQDQAEQPLPATNLAGQPLTPTIARFTVAPPEGPALPGEATLLEAAWQNGILLRGYTAGPPTGDTLPVRLFWETKQPLEDDYVIFVHLLDEAGHLVAQSDTLPRAGAYPTPWWRPGLIIEDAHKLSLPAELPAGRYQLAVGLYRSDNGERLLLVDGGDSVRVGVQQIKESSKGR
jgi:hypothetical protein